ncbi:MAG TPA: hypothetical protein VKC51_06600 [Lacunisphaera sp.]|nr:hypothetical protein [Lacunisphaera sp.]
MSGTMAPSGYSPGSATNHAGKTGARSTAADHDKRTRAPPTLSPPLAGKAGNSRLTESKPDFLPRPQISVSYFSLN